MWRVTEQKESTAGLIPAHIDAPNAVIRDTSRMGWASAPPPRNTNPIFVSVPGLERAWCQPLYWIVWLGATEHTSKPTDSLWRHRLKFRACAKLTAWYCCALGSPTNQRTPCWSVSQSNLYNAVSPSFTMWPVPITQTIEDENSRDLLLHSHILEKEDGRV